jgi:MFS family permease
MVTEWFFETEIVTVLAVMLTAWPIGFAFGQLSHGPITEFFGWTWVMFATAGLALIALLLTALLYRRPQALAAEVSAPLRFGLPKWQFIHISVVGIAWTLFNASLILVVSFAPDALAATGYGSAAARSSTSLCMWVALISNPLGGWVMERLGHVTPAIVVTLLISTGAALAIAQGLAPELSFVALGKFF